MRSQPRYLVLIIAIVFIVFSIANVSGIGSVNAVTFVDVPLIFHAYREHFVNASFYCYDGVDGCPPQQMDAASPTVEAHIHGTIDYPPFVYNLDYWQGHVVWNLTSPLSADLHVQGAITMSVWVSSNDDRVDGFFEGSGYGGAITDLNAQGEIIQIFEFPYEERQGSNIFSSNPMEYRLSMDVDYVFSEDHTIQFSFGFGSNVEGFTATVYFDAPDRPSGVTLPVRDPTVSFCDGLPQISITPTMWTETLLENSNRTREFSLANVGDGSLLVSAISESTPWLSILQDPTPLWLPSGNSTTFRAKMRSTSVTEIRSTVITVLSNDPDEGYYHIPVTMKVGIQDDPPTLDLTTPGLATVDEPIPILVNATDDHGVVSIAAFFNGTWHTQNCTGQTNCSFMWITYEPFPGRFYYKAKVQDTVGQWSNIEETVITITALAVHQDLGISDYTIPTKIAKGDRVTFSTVIHNYGSQHETATIAFTLNTSLVYQTSTLLAPGNSTSISYKWTAPSERATVTLQMNVAPLPSEINFDNNDILITLAIQGSQNSFPWFPFTVMVIALSFLGIIIIRRPQA